MADIGTSVHGLGVSGIVWEAEDMGPVLPAFNANSQDTAN